MSHNRLTYYNSQTREVEPELATSWEWVSDTELVFKLREDVTFQNGSKFNAEDVIFTFERSRSSALCSSKLVFLESFEALDEYTVKMTLTQHYTDWLILLSNCVFCILDKETCEADPDMGPGVGTGVSEGIKSYVLPSITLGFFYAAVLTRTTRSSILDVSNQDYLDTARAIALTDAQIIFQHVLPNCLSPILVQIALRTASSIITASALSYLGFGVLAPAPECCI